MSTTRPANRADDYRPDPPATPGPPRDLTRGSAKQGTCPTLTLPPVLRGPTR